MKVYFNDIIPRIEKFSKKIDDKAVLLRQPWIVLDEEGHVKKVYIFRSEGELLVSINGNVSKARWEILGHDNMLIENNSNSYLFNHCFLDSEVLILQKDNDLQYFTLVNNELFHKGVTNQNSLSQYIGSKYSDRELSVDKQSEKQLKETFSKNEADLNNTAEIKLKDNEEQLENDMIISYDKKFPYGLQIEKEVFDQSGKPLIDGSYYLKTSNKKINVKNGKIVSILYVFKYFIEEVGEVVIEQQDVNNPQKGDKVKVNGHSNVNGEYRLSWIESIKVVNGVVEKRKLLGLL